MFITETGCNLAETGTELQHELDAWNNSLTIFNEWELHYVAHWWRDIGIFRLLENGQTLEPTQSGVILMDKLMDSTPATDGNEEIVFQQFGLLLAGLVGYYVIVVRKKNAKK